MAGGDEAGAEVVVLGFEWQLVAELLLLGCCSGFVAGLLGVGGGMLLVPFLTLLLSHRDVELDMAVKMAIATSMAVILFTSLSSLRAHNERGAVRWDLVLALAPGIAVGGLLAGAGVFAVLKGAWLSIFFAIFVVVSATQILRNSRPAATRRMPGAGGQIAAGGAIGFLSGLVGAGGGFVAVPYMLWCNVTMHHVVATSAALGFPIALTSTLGYVIGGWSLPSALPGAFGYLYWPALFLVASTSVLLAPIGARVAHAMDVARLKRAFAGLLYGIAVYMLYVGVSGVIPTRN